MAEFPTHNNMMRERFLSLLKDVYEGELPPVNNGLTLVHFDKEEACYSGRFLRAKQSPGEGRLSTARN
jgi:hypothetical protein